MTYMWDQVIKYTTVFFSSMLKYAAGPIIGPKLGLELWETAIFTAFGMTAGVILFTQIGIVFKEKLKKNLQKKGKYKLFSKKNRRLVRIWKNFGIRGIAFLTPLLLTPIGGTIIALSFGVKKRYIFTNMTVSAFLWAWPTAYFFQEFEHGLERLF